MGNNLKKVETLGGGHQFPDTLWTKIERLLDAHEHTESWSIEADETALNTEDLENLLQLQDPDACKKLQSAANRMLAQQVGTGVYYRGIIEFSNICIADCNYCGIRKSNKQVDRFELAKEEVLEAALWCAEQGYGSIVLQSGERRDERFISFVEDVIREIKKQSISETLPRGVGITLSIGEQSYETYKRLFLAGAHRYLLRIETTNRELFSKIHPSSQRFEDRVACLTYLHNIGYQVGTGVMIGIPGQTVSMLAEDIEFFKRMDIDMIGMGPYITHPQAPLSSLGMMEKKELLQLALNMIAVTRLYLRDVNIAATTALQAIEPRGRELGLSYGANVTMPNLTPKQVRKNYTLYEGKPCTDETKQECRGCLLARVQSIGRDVHFDTWGDSKHYERKRHI